MWVKKLFRDFWPTTIKEYQSPINDLIQVVMAFNQPRLVVGGMVQSGGVVKKIWDKAIQALKNDGQSVNEALIIGLGCGDCCFSIQKYYPQTQMVGVEIDEKIVEAARCYFNLAVLKNLEIAISDGIKFVRNLTKQKPLKQFELIIVDVYLGQELPKPFTQERFLRQLKTLLKPSGIVVYNHLFFKKHKAKAKQLVETMEKIFATIKLQRAASNLLILASN